MYATLLNHYHLTLPEIGRLTDRQIADLYFHPREEDGSIKAQVEEAQPGSLEYELQEARIMARKMGVCPKALSRKVRERWSMKR